MAGRRGRFIVVEGIDGAGTTTQSRRLVARLAAEGMRAHLTREPSDGPMGVTLRQILTGRLLASGGRPIDAAAVALLFAADRVDHLRSEVEPSLADGVDVVSDRYVVSSLAYQGSELDLGWVRQVNARARAADLTLFLDVPPKVAVARREARGEAPERFDPLPTQRRIARVYRKVLEEASGLGPVERIDGRGSPDEVAEAVWKATLRCLSRRKR